MSGLRWTLTSTTSRLAATCRDRLSLLGRTEHRALSDVMRTHNVSGNADGVSAAGLAVEPDLVGPVFRHSPGRGGVPSARDRGGGVQMEALSSQDCHLRPAEGARSRTSSPPW